MSIEVLKEDGFLLKTALWIDLLAPTPEEEQFIEKSLGVDIPSRDEMHEIAASSRLFEEDGALYLSAWVLSFESQIPENSSVTFVFTKDRFLSIRYTDHHAFRIFQKSRSRLHRRVFKRPDETFAELLDAIAGHIASMLRLIEEDLNGLSLDIFSEQTGRSKKALGLKKVVQRLGKRNALVASLRESSVSLEALTPYYLDRAREWLSPSVANQLTTLCSDLRSLRDYDGELSAEISFLLDSTVGLIGFEQNRAMKILSVAAVVLALV